MAILICPPDFADHATSKTNRQLAEKYGVGEKTVTRWRKETGCTAAIRPFASAALPKQLVPSISPGLASEAAQFLRKTHRPVYHRIIEGKEFRGQYVVGIQVLTEAEVIALLAIGRAKEPDKADPGRFPIERIAFNKKAQGASTLGFRGSQSVL